MANTKVTSRVLANDAVLTANIADDQVTTAKIADDVALGGNPTTTTQTAGNNTTRIATTAFVTTAVANIVDSAPSALDTLNELAAALGDDANFSTTITNSIAAKLPLAGGTMTGTIAGFTSTGIDDNADATAITIDSSENVAIGHTTTTGSKLAICDGANSQIQFFPEISTDTNLTQHYDPTAAAYINAETRAASHVWKIGTSEYMRVHTDGNVGIGTDSPAQKLEVYNSATDSQSYVKIQNNRARNAAVNFVTTAANWYVGAGIGTDTDVFQIYDGDVGTRLLIDSSGNVGIGTASPDNKFHVYSGASGHSWSFDSGDALILENNDSVSFNIATPNSNSANILFSDAAARGQGRIVYDHGSDYMAFMTNGISSEKMRLDASGNLLVGRTIAEGNTTGLALQVNAANKYCSTLHNNGNSTNRYGIQIMSGTYDNSGTNTHVSFGDGNGDGVGTITSSGGTVTYGAFTAHHEVNIPDSDNPSDDSDAYPYGTLVEIVSVYLTDSNKRQSIRYTVQKSQSANSKKVLGAYASNMRPSPMCPTTGTYANNLHNISILGDGHVLCNNTGGNIEIGDGICTSAIEGIGMKATVNPSMIVAIAQEDVTFSGSETKLVAVQFGVQQFTPWS